MWDEFVKLEFTHHPIVTAEFTQHLLDSGDDDWVQQVEIKCKALQDWKVTLQKEISEIPALDAKLTDAKSVMQAAKSAVGKAIFNYGACKPKQSLPPKAEGYGLNVFRLLIML